MKKLISLVLAVAMVLGMMSVAFATVDPDAPAAETHTYTITIDNSANQTVSIVGKEYKAYKLFDMTYSGTTTTGDDDTPHAYTIKTTNHFYATSGSKTELDKYFYFTPSASDPTVMMVGLLDKNGKKPGEEGYVENDPKYTETTARTLADALEKFLPDTDNGSVTAESEKATINTNPDEAGYYIVYGTGTGIDDQKEVTAALALTSTDPTGSVKPKVSAPPLDKKITGEHKLDDAGKAATAQVGTEVAFELDSKIPDLTGYTDYTYTVTDTLSSGLTYVGDTITVKIKGETVDSSKYNFTKGTPTNGFTLTIPFNTLKTYAKDDAIVITYSATVNDGALTTDYEKNTANLTYSNNPYGTTTNKTPDEVVYVIDVDINVDKVAESKSGEKLKDAEFVAFKGSTQPADTDQAWYKWDKENKKVTWVTRANADVFKTNDEGKFVPAVQGLEAEKTGTAYGLLETKAPVGYNLLSAPVIVTLKAKYEETASGTSTSKTATVTAEGATVTNGTITLSADQNSNQPVATSQVINKTGTELPSTGGIGTTIFYLVGAALVLGAGVLLVTKRKMAVK